MTAMVTPAPGFDIRAVLDGEGRVGLVHIDEFQDRLTHKFGICKPDGGDGIAAPLEFLLRDAVGVDGRDAGRWGRPAGGGVRTGTAATAAAGQRQRERRYRNEACKFTEATIHTGIVTGIVPS